ncbi:MAG TPA: class I SAM-dependent methyltransferase [Candidatus Krumholzibacteria bacterium]|nr:class I SAM-dependent methyltransferase [Candidatus Krumholzibacteria bacterium]HPD73094.1 class I SAM-dependent methyltransferase [Candidatus Krumholzibacteria bacterium]HRY41894.1 class I SAM-dependent methyltransferase [Candidatus Krumholzibacteria bacterium]
MTSDLGGGLYLDPALYDVVNAQGTAREIDALDRVARRCAARSGPGAVWLEPGCGTGRYLRVLARRGRRVRGYDSLPAMLAYARARLVRGGGDWRLAAGSFTDPAADLVDLGPADVAFCPVNSLRHLADDGAVLAHLAQIAALLAPDGVYLVGIDLHHENRVIEEDVWEGARGGLHVTQVVQYLPPAAGDRRERVIVEVMATRPRGVEHRSHRYDLRTYTEREWRALVDGSALRRRATFDARGRPREGTARLPYQIEVLEPR